MQSIQSIFALLGQPEIRMMLAFVLALGVYFTLKLWLNMRQINFIMAHQSAVPAPFDTRIDLDAHRKSARYAFVKLRMARLALYISTAILLIWTLGGGIAGLIQLVQHGFSHPLHFGVALLVIFSLLNSLFDLPLAFVNQFQIEQSFGFNRMTVKMWLTDLFKSTLLSFVVAVPLLYAVLAFIQWLPQTWWFWAWALFLSFNILMMWLYPTVIAPLFNKFTPLPDGELKTRLEALLTRCGFTAKGMFVMDGSRRSGHGNAYFTGFGRSKRIVFFDTLIEQLTPAQIEAVLAHELGHFHHKHILKRMFWMLPMSLAGFALLGFLVKQLWFYAGLGVSDEFALLPSLAQQPTHLYAVGLLLFSLVLPVFLFILTPLFSMQSRRDEFQADAFAVKHANGQDLIDALVAMYHDNASFVGTDIWYSRFYDSHPPATIRVAQLKAEMANQPS
jgi:STE24 endopeptidase